MRQLVSVVIAATMAGGGCSFTFQDRAPRPPAPAPVTCSTANLFPIIDTAVGLALTAAGVAGMYYAWGRNHESYVLPSGSTIMVGWITLGSAYSGHTWAQRCTERGSGVAAR